MAVFLIPFKLPQKLCLFNGLKNKIKELSLWKNMK